MKPTTAVALRANLTLGSLSLSVASVPGLCVEWLTALDGSHLACACYQITTTSLAVLLVALARRHAAKAFAVGMKAGHIVSDADGRGWLRVSDECPRAWLAQLFIELHAPALHH